jgi:hypothetical protein
MCILHLIIIIIIIILFRSGRSIGLRQCLAIRGPCFSFLGPLDIWKDSLAGHQSSARPVPTQDNTTQKDADKHPCPE